MKTIRLPDKPAPSKNNGRKSTFSRNYNSRSISGKNNGDGEVNRFGVDKNGVEYAKKLGKLFKLGKLKSKKISKS